MATPLYGRGGPYTPRWAGWSPCGLGLERVGQGPVRLGQRSFGPRSTVRKVCCHGGSQPTGSPPCPAESTAVQRPKLAFGARRSIRSSTIDLPRTAAASFTQGSPMSTASPHRSSPRHRGRGRRGHRRGRHPGPPPRPGATPPSRRPSSPPPRPPARRSACRPTSRSSCASVLTDRDGTRHVRYDRTVDGLPVVGGDLVVAEECERHASRTATGTAARASRRPRRRPTVSQRRRDQHGREGRRLPGRLERRGPRRLRERGHPAPGLAGDDDRHPREPDARAA